MQLSPANNRTIILEQLDKLLNSPLLSSSALLRRFLTLAVTKTIQGDGEHLKEYVVGVEALGKSVGFDPQTDASVRIHAIRLRKLMAEYYSTIGKCDPILISLPKGRYTAVFKRNNASSNVAPLNLNASKIQEVKRPIIVIRPLKGIGANQSVDLFCKALALDLTTELAKCTELKVISGDGSGVVEAVAGDGLPAFNYILTGFYVCIQNQWRVTIELNDVVNRQIVWNESFDLGQPHELENVGFDRIIRKVIGTIGGYMGIIYQNALKTYVPDGSELLYGIYWYNYYHQNYSAEAHGASLKAIEDGLQRFPQNAFLTAFKAQLLVDLKVIDFQGDVDYLAMGTQLAYEAVGYDMASQHAWMIVGWANLLNHNQQGYLMAVEKMMAVNPHNLMYYGQLGFAYVCAGFYQKGYEAMKDAVQLCPYYPWNLNIAFCLYHIHRAEYEKALFYANIINRKLLIWDPMLRLAIHGLMRIHTSLDTTIEDIYHLSPNFHERAPFIVDALLWDKELQQTILRGLKNAGIPIVYSQFSLAF